MDPRPLPTPSYRPDLLSSSPLVPDALIVDVSAVIYILVLAGVIDSRSKTIITMVCFSASTLPRGELARRGTGKRLHGRTCARAPAEDPVSMQL